MLSTSIYLVRIYMPTPRRIIQITSFGAGGELEVTSPPNLLYGVHEVNILKCWWSDNAKITPPETNFWISHCVPF